MRMVSSGLKFHGFYIVLTVVAKLLQHLAASSNVTTESTSNFTGNGTTAFPFGNVTFQTLAPFLEPPEPPILLCGKQPPKTDQRRHCEDLHRERPNIARCPYSFPIYVFADVEQIKTSYDVRKLFIVVRIHANWSYSQLERDSQNVKLNYSSDDATNAPANATGRREMETSDGIATARETSACVPSNKSWMPQLFIWSSVTSNSTMFMKGDIEFTLIGKNNTFHLRSRLESKLWCKTSLWNYPFDSHACLVHIGVFQAQNYSVQPHWDSSVDVNHTGSGSFSTSPLFVSGFDVYSEALNGSLLHAASLDNREIFSLPLVIRLRRRSWSYVLNWYIPSCLLVILGWASFFVPDEIAEGRVLIVLFNALACLYLFQTMERVPTAGTVKAIDVWSICITFFIWLSVFTCILDLEYVFRGIESEQQETLPDLMFFYQQPKLARRMADTGHQEELERQRMSGRRNALVDRMLNMTGLGGTAANGDEDAATEERRMSRFDRRRHSTVDGDTTFFDASTGQSTPVGSQVDWNDFYKWAHERHAKHHPIGLEGGEDFEDGSEYSVKSLLQTMWNIRREYLWFTYSDYISKCVRTMYPVFFCLFVVIYCLVYIRESKDDIQV